MNPDKCPVAVLISGGGTTLKNLLDWQNAGKAEFQVALVISSSENAGGLQFAEQAGIPSCVISKQKSDTDSQAFSEAIFQRCDLAEVRYVVMGGFLKLLPIPDRFAGLAAARYELQRSVSHLYPGLEARLLPRVDRPD